MSTHAAAYDEIPYPTRARPWTHPDRLATLGTLFGMTPANPDRARVLELGCGDCSNLVGIAFHHPQARIVGVDYAAGPLQRGRAMAEYLGLHNLELHRADLLEYRPHEQFDYIIAHGLYSWVPEAVRTRIFEICRENLSEHGLGFISYNALPGWYFRMLVRDLMRYHTRELHNPAEKLTAAAEIAAWISGASPDDECGRVIREEVRHIAECDEHHIYHDDLAPIQEPIYLHEFIASAACHRLQYVADVDSVLGATAVGEGRKVQQFAGDNFVRGEQYLDFLHVRRFRQSLICHEGIALDRSLAAPPLQDMHVASSMPPGAEQPDGTQQFRLDANRTVTTNQPWAKHLLTTLAAAWPNTLPLAQFDGWQQHRDTILRLFAAEALRLRTAPIRAPRHAGDRPQVSALTRAEVAAGAMLATNPYHHMVDVSDPCLRELIPLLDGTRDRATLAAALTASVRTGRCQLDSSSGRDLESALPAQIEKALSTLGGSGLLAG
ncbi:MAG: methyltransferase regulatory domain-containing protein [Terriglobales bacterium]